MADENKAPETAQKAQETPAPKNMSEARERIAALEAELAALRTREAEAPKGPVRGRFARYAIYCHDAKGEKLHIPRGKPIPEGANLDGVNPEAIEEK